MKLSINQKVAIYASVLQGQMYREPYLPNQSPERQLNDAKDVANRAIMISDALIAALEARKDDNEADPHAEIPDA